MAASDSSVLIEDEYISNCVQSFIKTNPDYAGLDDKEITNILEERGYFNSFHSSFILDLAYSYLRQRCGDDANIIFETCFITPDDYSPSVIDILNINNICSVCEDSHISFLNSKYSFRHNKVTRSSSKHNLIDKGAVYTQPSIVSRIVKESCTEYRNRNQNEKYIHILDFACGTGRFYETCIDVLSKAYNLSNDEIVLNCLYAIDIDPDAINITRLKALHCLSEISSKRAEAISSHILRRNGLVQEGLCTDDFLPIKIDDCSGLFNEGFDIIVSNPPYLVLKPNKKISESAWQRLQNQIYYFRNSSKYQHSIEGMLNLYQLSIESMIQMLKPGGHLGVICPSTLFADLSASKIRKYILSFHNIYSVEYFAEKDDLFENVTQATCIFHLLKSQPTKNIRITSGGSAFSVDINLVKNLFSTNYEVPNITKIEWSILNKLCAFPKLSDFKNIRNKRGELDLTQYSSFITTDSTPYRLIRGRMIGKDSILDTGNEYVLPSFIEQKSEAYRQYDSGKIRLVCPQISNMSEKQRLHFVFCTSNDIIGNSCNYISSEKVILDKLKIILNSKLLNWRFKITSSNNHVSNYELAELPITNLDHILVDQRPEDEYSYNEWICNLYGLNEVETKFICNNETI